MIVKISYIVDTPYKIIAQADIDECNINHFRDDFKNIRLEKLLQRYNFRTVEKEEIDKTIYDVKEIFKERYYGLIEVDEDFNWPLLYVTTDAELISNDFTDRINKRQKELESEGCDFALFEDGSELWVISLLGDEIKGDEAYVVYGEDGEGYKGACVVETFEAAKKELLSITKDYTSDGFYITYVNEEMVKFNNDDIWEIEKVKIKRKQNERK